MYCTYAFTSKVKVAVAKPFCQICCRCGTLFTIAFVVVSRGRRVVWAHEHSSNCCDVYHFSRTRFWSTTHAKQVVGDVCD